MSDPKALVLRTTGSNCEIETARAFELGGASADIAHFDRVLEKPALIERYQILAFVGGFSFGDDLAAGRVWGARLRGEMREALIGHRDRGGLAIGICNGFQVLVESGIFEPDKPPTERGIALYANASNHYECRWVELETQASKCPWLVPGERFPVPVAHAEGRFVAKDEATLEALRANGQIALLYVGPDGAEPDYPANPNGALGHVAGICDPTGRVLGLMPHPERNLDPWNHPTWTRLGRRSEGEGAAFYRRMVEVAAGATV